MKNHSALSLKTDTSPEIEKPTRDLPIGDSGHATVVNQAEHELPSFLEQLSSLRETATAQVTDHIHFQLYDDDHRQQAFLRHKERLADPLLNLYIDYVRQGSPEGDFIELLVGKQPDSTLDKEQRRLASICELTLQHEFTLQAICALLDEINIPYTQPTEDQIRAGVDLCVMGKPYRFAMTNNNSSQMINARVDGVTRRALPPPFADGLPSIYVEPVYSEATVQSLYTTLGINKKTLNQAAKTAGQNAPQQTAQSAIKAWLRDLKPTATYEEESVTASIKDYIVNLRDEESKPPYRNKRDLESTVGESYALKIIDEALGDQVIDNYKLTRAEAAELIEASINDSDTQGVAVLKHLAAQLCEKPGVTSLADTVEPLASIMRANELRDFIVHVYGWSHPRSSSVDKVVSNYMNSLTGRRVETSFARVASHAGYQVTEGSKEEDALGIDYFVDGIPFDIKSSELGSKLHDRKVRRFKDRYHPIKFVPPFTSEDFEGELIIPDRNIERILATTDFCKLVDDAVAQYIKMEPLDDKAPPEEETASVEKSQADQEIDKLALNATRYWKRKGQSLNQQTSAK